MLKPGDVVEVRSPEEIRATLDDDATLDAMPFMPEMLRHAGKRFTVSRRVEKICDTVSGGPPNSRRMRDTVLLEDLRCDGSGHGGCQAGCRLYWKEAWLRRVDSDSEPADGGRDRLAELEELARAATTLAGGGDDAQLYRCQATEALRATEPQRSLDPGQYVRELRLETSGHSICFGSRCERSSVRSVAGSGCPATGHSDRTAVQSRLGASSTCSRATRCRSGRRRRSHERWTRTARPVGSGSTGR